MHRMNPDSEAQFLRHLSEAVKNNDAESFDRHIALGKAYFTPQAVVKLLMETLPPQLTDAENDRLQLLLADGELHVYRQNVKDFLDELVKLLVDHGLRAGVDFERQVGEDDSQRLLLSKAALICAEEHHLPGSLALCRPYLGSLPEA